MSGTFIKSIGVASLMCISIPMLSGCGDSDTVSDAVSDTVSDTVSPVEPYNAIATEQNMLNDDSIYVHSERNAVIYLRDPDSENDTTADAQTRGFGNFIHSVVHKVKVQVDKIGQYNLCLSYKDSEAHEIGVSLKDGNEYELGNLTQAGCKEVTLDSLKHTLHIEKASDNIPSDDEPPMFVTMDGNTINLRLNHCLGCNLSGIDFSNRHLIGTDLTGANLTDVKLKNAQFSFVDVNESKGFFASGVTAQKHHAGDLEEQTTRSFGSFVHHVTHAAHHVVTKVLHFPAKVANDIADDIVDIADDNLPDILNQGAEDDGGDLNIHDISFSRSIKAKKVKIKKPWFSSVIYHTYLEIDGYNKETYAWGAFGGNSGGDIVEGTERKCDEGETCIDSNTVAFMMHSNPCKWPVGAYARVGVCWNLTNRGLYYTDTTVSDVPYWIVIEGLFGTYGGGNASSTDPLSFLYSMDRCLEAQRSDAPWEGKDFRGAESRAARNQPKISRNPRIALYDEYHSNNKITRNVDKADNEFEYLLKLFKLNISENLGDIDSNLLDALLTIHKEHYLLFNEIDTEDQDAYIESFNALMDEQLSEYKRVLGDKDYSKLMNIESESESTFDLKTIL